MSTPARLLVVDDDPSARDTIAALLEREGHELQFADSGTAALALLEKELPDAILSDAMMPGLDGFELCRRIKTNPRLKHIPFVLVTALDSKRDLARGLEAGAEDFVPKPANGIELRARVRAMLRLKAQHDEISSLMQLRQDLVNMVVHDMRSPLGVILGSSELLMRRCASEPETVRGLERIARQASGLNKFLNDMLLMAKLEEGRSALSRSSQDVRPLVAEVEASHRLLAEGRGISLSVDVPAAPRAVEVDGALFQRVLDNLLSNALKFSSPGDTVRVVLEYPETGRPGLRLRVLDQGPGIPAEQREKIFGKFEVLLARRQGIAQVGLGLAFCRMVAEAHGGRVYVEPNAPRGSVFTLEI